MYGPSAVSEQALAVDVIERIPEGAGVIADRNFGIFQMAWELKDRPVLVRLTDSRAKSMLRGSDLELDLDRPFVWNPSQWDRKSHPDIPEDASISGRIIIRHVIDPKKKRARVILFTKDLECSAEFWVKQYTARWNIETDIRSLKHSLGLHVIRAKTPDMVQKELVLGVCAYNLVRAVMTLAARHTGKKSRKLSFTRACICIEILAKRGPLNQEGIENMYKLIAACPLPTRKKPRSYPREILAKHSRYPSRKFTKEGKTV